MYFRLSWKTWKALFIELVSFFYCIYFLLLLVIWLSVEKMFSTEPIAAFLDLCSCYIFWLHLWVNTNVDGCLKYVYNILIYHRSIYSWIVSFLRYLQISYRWVWESISYRIVTNHPIYTPSHQRFNSHFKKLREYFLCAKTPQNNDFIQQFVSSTSPWHHFGEYHEACYDLNVIRVSVWCYWHRTCMCAVFTFRS